jgi:hypothetical protein
MAVAATPDDERRFSRWSADGTPALQCFFTLTGFLENIRAEGEAT